MSSSALSWPPVVPVLARRKASSTSANILSAAIRILLWGSLKFVSMKLRDARAAARKAPAAMGAILVRPIPPSLTGVCNMARWTTYSSPVPTAPWPKHLSAASRLAASSLSPAMSLTWLGNIIRAVLWNLVLAHSRSIRVPTCLSGHWVVRSIASIALAARLSICTWWALAFPMTPPTLAAPLMRTGCPKYRAPDGKSGASSNGR